MPSTLTPLHQLARERVDSLLERFDTLARTRPESASVAHKVQERGRASVNMKPSALLGFFESRRQKNTFDLANEEAARSGRSADDLLGERLGKWFERRMWFEREAGGDHRFYYGALNIGGMGAPRFGGFCVVAAGREGSGFSDPVWVWGDTLSCSMFWDADGRLRWEDLGSCVARADLAGELAALKLDTTSDTGASLADRICNDSDYIEALSSSPLLVEGVQEVRSKIDDALQVRACDAILNGATLADELDLALHAQLRDRADELGIPWKQEAS